MFFNKLIVNIINCIMHPENAIHVKHSFPSIGLTSLTENIIMNIDTQIVINKKIH